MAISKTILKRTLTINTENGTDSEGVTRVKAHNYTGINPGVTLDGLHKAGAALGGLMERAVESIVLTEKDQLTEE